MIDDTIHVSPKALEGIINSKIALKKTCKADNVILFYEAEHYYLSNFSSFRVLWNGRMYPTSEHAYQASKFIEGHPDNVLEIYNAISCHEAKKVAERNEHLVDAGWADRKIETMRDIIEHKLEQHQYIQKMLYKTGDAVLIEDSPKDSFWGRGPEWDGNNMLGQIWCQVRDAWFKDKANDG